MFKAYLAIKSSQYWASVQDFTVRVKPDYVRVEVWDPQYPNEPSVMIFKGHHKDRFLQELEAMEKSGDIEYYPDVEDKGEWVSPYPPEPELDLAKMERLREETTPF